MTPNLDEAAALAGHPVCEPEDMGDAARAIHERFGCAVLVKGGHMKTTDAIDLFYDGKESFAVGAPCQADVATGYGMHVFCGDHGVFGQGRAAGPGGGIGQAAHGSGVRWGVSGRKTDVFGLIRLGRGQCFRQLFRPFGD